MQSAWRPWVVALVAMLAVGLVAAATVALQAQSERPGATGAGPRPAQAGSNCRFTLATAPLGEKRTGVFILDSETMRLLIYSIEGDSRMLKLVAVRDVSQDARLSHYNNEHPWPDEIRQRVEGGQEGEQK